LRGRPHERGFALLIVLWALVLLTLVFTQLVSAGRGEAELTANLRAGATAEAAADAGVYQAIFHLHDPSPARWAADGAAHVMRLPGASVSVSIVDLAGRINPNTASAALLAALMSELGADRTTADTMAEAIVDWRVPDAQGRFGPVRYIAAGLPYGPARSGFQSLDEVGLVLGMSPAMLALLAPHLSLASPDNPDPRFADPVVLRAMRDIKLDTTPTAKPGGPRNVMITAAAAEPSGARFVRRATVRLGSARPFAFLSWDSLPWQ
jgi:general secretion pathway protein K